MCSFNKCSTVKKMWVETRIFWYCGFVWFESTIIATWIFQKNALHRNHGYSIKVRHPRDNQRQAYWLLKPQITKTTLNDLNVPMSSLLELSPQKFIQTVKVYAYVQFFFRRVFFIQCQLHTQRKILNSTHHTPTEEQEKYWNLREIFVAMEFQLITFYFLTKNSFI